MVGKTELKELLKKVKSAEDVEKIKPEIKEVLSRLNPTDLALAEQELMAEGISPEEIRKLCGPHLELLREGLEKERPTLDHHHPIQILKDEHEVILQNLSELHRIIEKANTAKNFNQLTGELEKLKDIAHHLVEAESHHKREEDVLFPKLEVRGVTGPPMVMRMEHDELRQRKHVLKELAENPKVASYTDFVSRLNEVGGYIVQNLND
ncbi:MAG: DUF438 domain-containing protein, partial [Candidatus Freyarchaeota archaeon]|nr:DUF438 domain-containing protein [Candidatus Jordarchaeia archaeon]